MAVRPVAIDLFSGAGGMSLGFEQAGFDISVAVEYDPIHASVHHYNFPLTRTLATSVIGLSKKDLTHDIRNEIDVIFGGAPCQGFSLIGQRALDDERNQLVKEFLRIIADLKPKYFVFENVKGLTMGKHRDFLFQFIDGCNGHGYQVLEPWRVLNAHNYNVPQHRERLFLIGYRNDCPAPDYPSPITSDQPDFFTENTVSSIPTCADALNDLPNNENFETLLTSDSVEVQSWKSDSEYSKEMRCLSNDGWHYGYKRSWNPNMLTNSMRTDHTEISRRRFKETCEGDTEPISRFFKLHRNGQCNTLRAGTDSSRGAFTSPRPIHYAYDRCISVREMARLHGFPDWFRFHITKWHGARQIGNSVPPPLARAVATSIIKALNYIPTCPDKVMHFPSDRLLAMDMTEASRYWKVTPPIGPRDKKSGAKKRKQDDIERERLIVHYG